MYVQTHACTHVCIDTQTNMQNTQNKQKQSSSGSKWQLTTLDIENEASATVDQVPSLVPPELELEERVATVTLVDLLVVHLGTGTGLHWICEVAMLDIDYEARGSRLDVEPACGKVIGANRDGFCSWWRWGGRSTITTTGVVPCCSLQLECEKMKKRPMRVSQYLKQLDEMRAIFFFSESNCLAGVDFVSRGWIWSCCLAVDMVWSGGICHLFCTFLGCRRSALVKRRWCFHPGQQPQVCHHNRRRCNPRRNPYYYPRKEGIQRKAKM